MKKQINIEYNGSLWIWDVEGQNLDGKFLEHARAALEILFGAPKDPVAHRLLLTDEEPTEPHYTLEEIPMTCPTSSNYLTRYKCEIEGSTHKFYLCNEEWEQLCGYIPAKAYIRVLS